MRSKNIFLIIRWIVGILFIFSGLVKANDPLGLAYKMQEFFEAWNMQGLNGYALALSFIMNVFEVLAGVAIIVGWRIKLFTWLLLLLILFFCFLTGYAYLSGKFRTCGCFGDCLPLTPLASFIKDIILLLLILVLFINRKNIGNSFSGFTSPLILMIAVIAVSWMQFYALKNLPFKDCLAYKAGSNIIESMKLPPGSAPDSVVMTFKYKKNNQVLEFDAGSFPADFDSTYEYVDRYDKVVKPGTGVAAITDFALQTLSGGDTTYAIINQPNYYLMVFAMDFSMQDKWENEIFASIKNKLAEKDLPLFIVTSDKEKGVAYQQQHKDLTVLVCDGTVIKTAARVNATYLLMEMGNIRAKFSYADAVKILERLKDVPANSVKNIDSLPSLEGKESNE